MKKLRLHRMVAILALGGATLLAACGPAKEPYRDRDPGTKKAEGSITGGGLSGLFTDTDRGPAADGSAAGPGGGVGVNTYLWRASLDTLSFMPVASADPFGGVIITDWYTPPETQGERFKINLYILGRELRANGLRASVFRQVRKNGEWVDAEVAKDTATELENAILSRARELRVAGR